MFGFLKKPTKNLLTQSLKDKVLEYFDKIDMMEQELLSLNTKHNNLQRNFKRLQSSLAHAGDYEKPEASKEPSEVEQILQAVGITSPTQLKQVISQLQQKQGVEKEDWL